MSAKARNKNWAPATFSQGAADRGGFGILRAVAQAGGAEKRPSTALGKSARRDFQQETTKPCLLSLLIQPIAQTCLVDRWRL